VWGGLGYNEIYEGGFEIEFSPRTLARQSFKFLFLTGLSFLLGCVGGALESDPIMSSDKICLRFSQLTSYQYYMQENPLTNPRWETVQFDQNWESHEIELRNINGGAAFYYGLAPTWPLILKLGPDVNYSYFKDHPEKVQVYLENAGHVLKVSNRDKYLITVYPAPDFANTILFHGSLLEAGRIKSNRDPVKWYSAQDLMEWAQEGNNTTITSLLLHSIQFEIVVNSRTVDAVCKERYDQCMSNVSDGMDRHEDEYECNFNKNVCLRDCKVKG